MSVHQGGTFTYLVEKGKANSGEVRIWPELATKTICNAIIDLRL
jgi:hypothetical protein